MKATFLPSMAAVCLLLAAGCGNPSDSGNGSGSGNENQSGNAGNDNPPAGSGLLQKGDAKPKIVFVSNGVADFWTIAEAGVKQAGEDLNAEVEVYMPTEGITDQKRIIEDLISKGIDGLSVSPIDPVNQTDLLNKVAEKTKLVTNDSDAPKANRLCYIGMDNYKAGRMCGQLVKEALPDGGKVMIFVGRLEQDNAKGRRQGVIDELLDREFNPSNFDEPGKVITGDKYIILGTLTDQFDRARAKANAEDTLSKHEDIDGMIGLFAYNPPLILEALKGNEKVGKVKVIAFDENDATLQGIKDGSVHGTVVQNPYVYGYKSVEVLYKIIKGESGVVPEGKFIDIPARQIRKDTVDAFWLDLKKKTGKD
tara:strand:+ start:5050 stop:6147 length:1098 start_codon:yes stop_codon:yes gene_type:complete